MAEKKFNDRLEVRLPKGMKQALKKEFGTIGNLSETMRVTLEKELEKKILKIEDIKICFLCEKSFDVDTLIQTKWILNEAENHSTAFLICQGCFKSLDDPLLKPNKSLKDDTKLWVKFLLEGMDVNLFNEEVALVYLKLRKLKPKTYQIGRGVLLIEEDGSRMDEDIMKIHELEAEEEY